MLWPPGKASQKPKWQLANGSCVGTKDCLRKMTRLPSHMLNVQHKAVCPQQNLLWVIFTKSESTCRLIFRRPDDGMPRLPPVATRMPQAELTVYRDPRRSLARIMNKSLSHESNLSTDRPIDPVQTMGEQHRLLLCHHPRRI